MVNGYIISPKDLVVRTDNTPTLNPLAFSASQINTTTDMPYGITAVNGKVYFGTHDELPVFVRYNNGRADILDKPDTESVAYASFVVSGTSLLLLNHSRLSVEYTTKTRPTEEIERVAIGLFDNGNVFVLYCKATVRKLQSILDAHKVSTAILLASDNVYFNNPRNNLNIGEQPVLSIQATYYEELPSPVVVIDPAHGGADPGNYSARLLEKDLTLEIAKAMQKHLKNNYYGTFALTRSDDTTVPLTTKVALTEDLQADLFYSVHINAFNGLVRGFECYGYVDTSENVKDTLRSLHKRLAELISPQGVSDNGMSFKDLKMLGEFPCATFTASMLYMDNAEDAHMLSKPEVLKLLGIAQAEALAYAMGLNKRVETSRITSITDDSQYVVRVGKGFNFKLGALELCEKLRQLGFDAYVTKE